MIAWTEPLGIDDSEAHDAIAAAVIAGYNVHPEVRARPGFPGQAGGEVSIGVLAAYVSEGLLERGPIYRPTPSDA